MKLKLKKIYGIAGAAEKYLNLHGLFIYIIEKTLKHDPLRNIRSYEVGKDGDKVSIYVEFDENQVDEREAGILQDLEIRNIETREDGKYRVAFDPVGYPSESSGKDRYIITTRIQDAEGQEVEWVDGITFLEALIIILQLSKSTWEVPDHREDKLLSLKSNPELKLWWSGEFD